MKIGTKSVLFGAHCFLFHWAFVALGWWKLHGFKPVFIGTRSGYPMNRLRWRLGWRGGPVFASLWKPQLWIAFVVHDIGYIGKPNMDGAEGERHPETGAAIMRRLFGEPWGKFVLYHSRFLAKQHRAKPSPLCMADKLAFPLTPRWLYLPFVRATGEIHEFMAKAHAMNETGAKYDGMHHPSATQEQWHRDVCDYVTRWVAEHRDGRDDTWTKATKAARTDSGVWS